MDPRHYGFADSVKRAFSQYAKFDGVASVAEFWWFYLFNLIVVGVLYFLVFVLVIGAAAGGGDGEAAGASTVVVVLILGLYGLAVLLPSLGLTIRRLHDAGYSGFFVLLEFVGLGIVTLVLCIFPSKPAAWNPSWLDDEARALQAHMLGGANPYAQGAYGAPMMPEYTQGPAVQAAPYGQGVPQAPYGQPTPQTPYGQGGPQAPYGQGGSAPSSY
jgi:putative membrane protein